MDDQYGVNLHFCWKCVWEGRRPYEWLLVQLVVVLAFYMKDAEVPDILCERSVEAAVVFGLV